MRGGAWCPRSVIREGAEEWLEINLHRPFRITATETQGRFGGGQGQEFTEFYQLQYWRDTLGNILSEKFVIFIRRNRDWFKSKKKKKKFKSTSITIAYNFYLGQILIFKHHCLVKSRARRELVSTWYKSIETGSLKKICFNILFL